MISYLKSCVHRRQRLHVVDAVLLHLVDRRQKLHLGLQDLSQPTDGLGALMLDVRHELLA